MDKGKMREQYRYIRDNMHKADVSAKSLAIINRLLNSEVYAKTQCLFTYVNYGSEVETISLIEVALRHGKKVAVPIMLNPKERKMVFQQITGLNCLSKNKYGIMEPEYDESLVVTPDRKTLVVVPGLAFDANGYRLGYGGGYYDRYLSEHRTLANYGIAFEKQRVDRILIDGYDVRLDGMITEENTYIWEV